MSLRVLTTAMIWLLVGVSIAAATEKLPRQLRDIGFDQNLNAQIPLDLEFQNESGQTVRLGKYFQGRPVILVFAYFRCPMLCDRVLNGLVQSMLDMSLEIGQDYEVITISFDPRETPEMAQRKKKTYVTRFGHPAANEHWHFLTGQKSTIEQLTKKAGFRYRYDERNDEFAHASGIIVLTPTGKISRYFFDVQYEPGDLRLGLVEASANEIGSPIDQVLLFCFHYDPSIGKYGLVIMNLVRLGGIITLLAVGWLMFALWRQERKKHRDASTPIVPG